MDAIRINHYGGPEVLRLEPHELPAPGPGQVRVGIAAAGVNFIDVYHRTGAYPGELPRTLGQEAAGVVEEVGPGVFEVAVGDRVAYAMQPGAYAQAALVPASLLVPVPEDVDLRHAAAVLLQGLTAHYLSHSTYALNEGDTALVHAAAGGVGQLLVQLARQRGARVIATVSTLEKEQIAREAGAHEVIRYTEQDFQQATRALTEGQGVDVVYDSVGRDTFEGSLGCLRPRGLLALYGQSSGAVPPIDPQRLSAGGSLFLTRPTLKHYTASREELLSRSDDLFTGLATGSLRLRIDHAFPLAQAAEAHRYLEARKTRGKLLLIP